MQRRCHATQIGIWTVFIVQPEFINYKSFTFGVSSTGLTAFGDIAMP